jgi:hypothetical protein
MSQIIPHHLLNCHKPLATFGLWNGHCMNTHAPSPSQSSEMYSRCGTTPSVRSPSHPPPPTGLAEETLLNKSYYKQHHRALNMG